MPIKLLISSLISSISFLLVSASYAAETPTQMNRDEWLGKLKSVAPATICKSFTENEEVSKQMVAAKIDYAKCITLVPSIFDKCQTKYYGDIPATLDKAQAEKWGGGNRRVYRFRLCCELLFI